MAVTDEFVYLFKAKGEKDVQKGVDSLKTAIAGLRKEYEKLDREAMKDRVAQIRIETAEEKKKGVVEKNEAAARLRESKEQSAALLSELKAKRERSKLEKDSFSLEVAKRKEQERQEKNKQSALKKEQREKEKALRQDEKRAELEKASLKRQALLIKAGASYVAYKAFQFYKDTAQEAQNVSVSSFSAGVDTTRLQAMGLAAKRFGGDMSTMSKTLQGLNQTISEFKLGFNVDKIAPLAAKFGVRLDGVGDAETFLRRIGESMQGKDVETQKLIGRSFGLDEATIQMLSQGVDKFFASVNQFEKTTQFNDKTLKTYSEAQKALLELEDASSKAMTEAFAPIAKDLTTAMRGIAKFFGSGSVISGLKEDLSSIWTGMTLGLFRPKNDENWTEADEEEFFEPIFQNKAQEKISAVEIPNQASQNMRLLNENVAAGGAVLTTLNSYGGATNNTANTFNMNANVNVSSGGESAAIGQAAMSGTQNGLLQNAARLQTMLQGTGQ
nr:MAG TPA: tail tape measure [Caudoviricetes sp.]